MILTGDQLDILTEIVNIGIGNAASILNELSGTHIELSVPNVEMYAKNEFSQALLVDDRQIMSAVSLAFKGPFNGLAQLLFTMDGAAKLVGLFTDDEIDEDEDFDSIKQNTLSEIGNIVLNSLIGTISNILKLNLTFTPPSYMEGNVSELFNYDEENYESYFLLARTKFMIKKLEIAGDFVLFFEIGSLDTLLNLTELYFNEGL